MKEKSNTCAHVNCSCPAADEYCGDYCKANADDARSGCLCGHPQCNAVAAASKQ
jgi:hypothetical protein